MPVCPRPWLGLMQVANVNRAVQQRLWECVYRYALRPGKGRVAMGVAACVLPTGDWVACVCHLRTNAPTGVLQPVSKGGQCTLCAHEVCSCCT